jgi:hypothetical protein
VWTLLGGGHSSEGLRLVGQIALVDVRDVQDRLRREQLKTFETLLVVGVELDLAQRRFGLQGLPTAFQQGELLGVLLAGGAELSAFLEPRDARVEHRHVAEDDLVVEIPAVALEVDRAVRMHH